MPSMERQVQRNRGQRRREEEEEEEGTSALPLLIAGAGAALAGIVGLVGAFWPRRRTSVKNYEIIGEIGNGAFGSVYRVRAGGKDYAMKRQQTSNDEDLACAAQTEIQVLSKLNHPNIVKCIESFIDKNDICIVMECCEGGNLRALINRGKPFTQREVVGMFRQLCMAVNYIHTMVPIVLHRDIKPENILFTNQGVLKLCDFGLSKMLEKYVHYAQSVVGTPVYMAPEVIKQEQVKQPYDSKCDIWSMGCVLYELVTLNFAFSRLQNVLACRYQPVPSHVNAELRDIIDQILVMDRKQRPDAANILSRQILN